MTEDYFRYARYRRRFRRADHVELLNDGDEAFPRMLEAIEQAQEFINIGFYKWRADQTGWMIAEALARKSRQGVQVRALYDSLGCIDVDPLIFETMEIQGIQVHRFRPLAPWRPKWGVFGRWHNKLLVVDNQIAFCGGINLTDDHQPKSAGGHGWRDSCVRIEGASVSDLNRLFLNTWDRQRHETTPRPPPHHPPPGGRQFVAIESSNRLQFRIRNSYVHAIKHARSSIAIANAYFLPGLRIRTMLYNAVRRGVEVSIIVPGKNDIKLIGWATKHLYGRLLKRGVRLYEWTGSMLHAKVATVDNIWSTVGSSNLDHLSLRRNREANVIILDEEFGTQLRASFDNDLAHCREVTLESWKKRSWFERIRSWFFFQIRAIL